VFAIGDLVLGKYKKTPQWFGCVIVATAEGGRWQVEWEDGDEADVLKEDRHLKKKQ